MQRTKEQRLLAELNQLVTSMAKLSKDTITQHGEMAKAASAMMAKAASAMMTKVDSYELEQFQLGPSVYGPREHEIVPLPANMKDVSLDAPVMLVLVDSAHPRSDPVFVCTRVREIAFSLVIAMGSAAYYIRDIIPVALGVRKIPPLEVTAQFNFSWKFYNWRYSGVVRAWWTEHAPHAGNTYVVTACVSDNAIEDEITLVDVCAAGSGETLASAFTVMLDAMRKSEFFNCHYYARNDRRGAGLRALLRGAAKSSSARMCHEPLLEAIKAVALTRELVETKPAS